MALGSSLLPALLRARERGAAADATRLQQYYDLNAAVAYGLSVPMALAAPWVVAAAYGPEFAGSAPIVAIHIWSSVFVFLGVARGQWLVNEGLQKFYLAATMAGAVANVGLNLIFIPRWGGVGAAWATLISYAVAVWGASYTHPAVRATAATARCHLTFRRACWAAAAAAARRARAWRRSARRTPARRRARARRRRRRCPRCCRRQTPCRR